MDRAQPGARGSTNRNIEFGETTGQYTDGWIVSTTNPTLSSQRYTSLDETAFNEFDASYTVDSLTVTIGPGEAFVDGWFARDEPSDIELAAGTEGQTVVIGWDPDAIYDDQQHDVRDDADRVIISLESETDPMHPTTPIFTFKTDASGVTDAVDHRDIGPELGKNIVGQTAINYPEVVVDNPDRYQAAELDDGDSYEIPVQVPNGHRLAVYRWGCYDADTNSAPSGLDVQLLDGGDLVREASNTVDEYSTDQPVASHQNDTGGPQSYILRGKNSTGNPIGDGDTDRGVGMHFGYLVEE